MSCARCDFYTPKAPSNGQLIEAKDNLQRMLVGIPLTDDERAAVDNDQAAVDRLLQRLVDVATSAGPTLRQLSAEPGRQLPLTVLPRKGKVGATARCAQPCSPSTGPVPDG